MITAISIVDPELAGLNCLSWWKGLLQNLLDTTAKGQLHSSLCLWAKKLNLTLLAGILMCKVTILQLPHTIHCDCPFCRLYYCMFFFNNSSSQRILLETVSENLQQSSCFHKQGKLCYQQPSITAVAYHNNYTFASPPTKSLSGETRASHLQVFSRSMQPRSSFLISKNHPWSPDHSLPKLLIV